MLSFRMECSRNSSLGTKTLSDYDCIREPVAGKSKCKNQAPTHEKYQKLLNNIMDIKTRCGNLCTNIGVTEHEHQPYSNDQLYNPVFKKLPIVCESLWNTSIYEEASTFKYPIQILPRYIVDYYSYNDIIDVTLHYNSDIDTENHVTNSWCAY